MRNRKRQKVIVAMSGGVDSSVAAALLKKQGFEVIGIFLHFWKEPNLKNNRENLCCSLESQIEARKVAQILKIPFYTLNVSREFKKEVVDYFIRDYAKGNTPNPCVVCNREIKFKVLFRKMLELKADWIATGHYAQLERNSLVSKSQSHKELRISKDIPTCKLLRASDKEKDQSYFLYNLNQKQLARIMFPVGDYQKSEVRKIAKRFKLPIHSKPESQDICFVSDSVAKFLGRQIRMKKGKIIDLEGKILGEHQGLPLYTLGQRKGLNVGGRGPYFVAEKNKNKNQLLVTNDSRSKNLLKSEFGIKNAHWVSGGLNFPLAAQVQLRYRTQPVYGIIEKTKRGGFLIKLRHSQWAITPGQSAVFYGPKGEVLGGGIIK
jgi:tRNA-specific 2-thiouridylase